MNQYRLIAPQQNNGHDIISKLEAANTPSDRVDHGESNGGLPVEK